MHKNSTSKSGFVRLRLFVAIALCAIGSSLVLVSFGSTPSSGTLTEASGPLTYTAGPFFQPNAFGNSIAGECDPDPSDPLVPCDVYKLHVSLPAGYAQAHPNQHLFVRIEWPTPGAEFDLYLWDAKAWAGTTSFPNGAPLASSTQTGTTFQQVEVAPDAADNGEYVVQVSTTVPAGQSFTGTISLAPASAGHGPVVPPGNASGIAPRFQEYIPTDANGAPSSSLGLFAGEPTLGVDTKVHADKGGDLFYQGLLEILRVRFDDSTSPAKATWEFKDAPNGISNKATTDPIFLSDPLTGRLWALQLTGGDSLTDISDDDGETWSPAISGGIGTGVDHEGLGVGPYPKTGAGALIQHPLYPNALYYCSQQIATAFCARSDDGGETYGPIVSIYNSVTDRCVGLHGHPKVAPDGTVYVPNKGCALDTPVIGNGLINVVVSEDAGATWSIRPVPDSTGGLVDKSDPSVGIDKDGAIYLAYQNLNNNHQLVAVSHDRGVTFSPSVDVGALAGVNYSVFPAVTAGDSGRAAVAFFGSTYDGPMTDYQSMAFPGVWYLYIATTYDGGKTWFVANTTPDHPIQGAYAGISGGGDGRNHYDFIDAQIDTQGRVIASNSIGCAGSCVNLGGPNTFAKLAGIVRQSGGRRMLAQFDPAEPTVPAAPFLSGYRTAQNVVLTWPGTDGSGADVTGYNVYRRIDGGAETKIASATKQRLLVDAADPAKTYAYRVAAINAHGAGPLSNSFAPKVGDNAPKPELSCALPGVVYADRVAEGAAYPNNDIASFSIAEPSDMPGKLVFVINNAHPELTSGGNSDYYVYFDPSAGSPAAKGKLVTYRLNLSSGSVDYYQNLQFVSTCGTAGTDDCRDWKVAGALDSASGVQSDGSVWLVIDKTTFGIENGDVLLGIAVREDTSQNPSGVLASDYAGGRQNYTVVGNDFCTKPSPTPTPSPTASGTPGPTPTPSTTPSVSPTASPSASPTASPSASPSASPTATASATATPTPSPTEVRFVNISTRVRVGVNDDVGIGGFIVHGNTKKRVIIRALGPSLNVKGTPVAGRLSDPRVDIYDRGGNLIGSNDNWRSSQEQEIKDTQLAPSDDKEAAVVLRLDPGDYTAIISGVGGETGVGLIEVYDLEDPSGAQAVNLSTRGKVGTADDVLIGGIILHGSKPHKILFRGIGPELSSQGVSGSLDDPTMELRNANGALISRNDNWKDTQESQIEETGIAPKDDREPAIVRLLTAGNYTAIVAGANNTTGVALVEAYNIGSP